MKAYLVTTGSLFALVGAAHLLRMVVEGGHSLGSDPWFFVANLGLGVLGGGVGAWALYLYRIRAD